MRFAMLIVAAALGGLSAASASAATFQYTGAIVQDTITTTGVYSIEAVGAAGANNYYGTSTPGLGADLVATFEFTAGTTLDILVGGKGQGAYYGGAGGGGSFVVTVANAPLLVAGGGGGAGYVADTGLVVVGGNGQTGTSGGSSIGRGGAVQGQGGTGGNGGALGNGYESGYYAAGAGGGFATDGASNTDGYGGAGGASYLNGGAGGVGYQTGVYPDNGGFGGGGGVGYYGAGGGGGYSGGGGSDATSVSYGAGGGGGGSFIAESGTLTNATSGVSTSDGNGFVSITEVMASVPEPSTWAMLLLGFGGIGFACRVRRGVLMATTIPSAQGRS